jgi:cytochrome c
MEGIEMPENVRQVLGAKCADCHSMDTHYPAYSRLAPASWLIERDVLEGRQHLDMSQWRHYSMESQIDLLAKIGSEARSGEMPKRQYLILHPQARLSPIEQQLLYDWAKGARKRIKSQIADQPDQSSANQGTRRQ